MKEEFTEPMSVHQKILGGYEIVDMTESDLRSLHAMIKSACLPERQTFNRVKEQIEKILGL